MSAVRDSKKAFAMSPMFAARILVTRSTPASSEQSAAPATPIAQLAMHEAEATEKSVLESLLEAFGSQCTADSQLDSVGAKRASAILTEAFSQPPQPIPELSHLPCRNDVEYITVPADGLCLSHVASAHRDIGAWLVQRDARGWRRDRRLESEDTQQAKRAWREVTECMEHIGHREQATRLRLSGAQGWPGMDELPHYAAVLGGRVELVHLDDQEVPIITYGHSTCPERPCDNKRTSDSSRCAANTD